MLPGRGAEVVAGWLRAHPGVEFVCRDGSAAYAQAVRDALPQAIQAHAQHALDLYRATGDRTWESLTLSALGWYEAHLGNYQRALVGCHQALDLIRELGSRDGEAHTLRSIGYAHHNLGHHTLAVNFYHDARTLFRELGDHFHEANVLTHLGDTLHATGDRSDARDIWRQALAILDQLVHPDADIVRGKLADLDTESTHRPFR